MMSIQKNKGLWFFAAIGILVIGSLIALKILAPRSTSLSSWDLPFSRTERHDPLEAITNPAIKHVVEHRRTWGPIELSWLGKPAPDMTITDIDGNTHKLSDYRGKEVMIVFWATWCTPCLMEIPHLITLKNIIGEENLTILGISFINRFSGETPEKVAAFAQENPQINYPLFSVNIDDMPEPFSQVKGFPTTYYIDKNGNIKLATTGLIYLPEMKAIVQAED